MSRTTITAEFLFDENNDLSTDGKKYLAEICSPPTDKKDALESLLAHYEEFTDLQQKRLLLFSNYRNQNITLFITALLNDPASFEKLYTRFKKLDAESKIQILVSETQTGINALMASIFLPDDGKIFSRLLKHVQKIIDEEIKEALLLKALNKATDENNFTAAALLIDYIKPNEALLKKAIEKKQYFLLEKMLDKYFSAFINIASGTTSTDNILFFAMENYFTDSEAKKLLSNLILKLDEMSPEVIHKAVLSTHYRHNALVCALLAETENRLTCFSDKTQFQDITLISTILKLMKLLSPEVQKEIFMREFNEIYFSSDIAQAYEKEDHPKYVIKNYGHKYKWNMGNILLTLTNFYNQTTYNSAREKENAFISVSALNHKEFNSKELALSAIKKEMDEINTATNPSLFVSYLDALFSYSQIADDINEVFNQLPILVAAIALNAILGLYALKNSFQADVIDKYSPASFSNYDEFIALVLSCIGKGCEFQLDAKVFIEFLMNADPIIILKSYENKINKFILEQLKDKQSEFDLLKFIRHLNSSTDSNSSLEKEVYTLLSNTESLPDELITLLAKHEKLKETVLAHIKTLSLAENYANILETACTNTDSNLNKFFKVQRSLGTINEKSGVFKALNEEYQRVRAENSENNNWVELAQTPETINLFKIKLREELNIFRTILSQQGSDVAIPALESLEKAIDEENNIEALEKLQSLLTPTFVFLSNINLFPASVTAENREATRDIRDTVKTAYNDFNNIIMTLDFKTSESLKEFTDAMAKRCEALKHRLNYVEHAKNNRWLSGFLSSKKRTVEDTTKPASAIELTKK